MFSTPFAYAHPLGLTLPFAVSPFAALPYGPIMPLGAQAYGNMALAPPPFAGYESNAGSSNKRTSEGQSKGQEAKGQEAKGQEAKGQEAKGAGLFLGEWEPQHGAEHGVGVVVRFDGDYAEDGAARRERRQSRAWRLAEDECLVQAAAQFHARHWKRVAQRLQRLFPLVVASHNQHNADHNTDHKHSTGHKHQPQPIEVCPDRTADQCCQRWTRVLGPRMARARWSAARDAALLRAVAFCVAARTSPQEPLPHQHLPHEATALELPSDVCDALSWADVALSLAAHDLTALHCRFRFYTLRRAAKDTARKESSATNTIATSTTATSTTATSTTATSTTSETCGRTGTPLGGGGGGDGSRGGESLGDSSADSSADSCSAHTPSSPPVSPAPLPEPSDRTRYLSIHALLN